MHRKLDTIFLTSSHNQFFLLQRDFYEPAQDMVDSIDAPMTNLSKSMTLKQSESKKYMEQSLMDKDFLMLVYYSIIIPMFYDLGDQCW